MKNKNEPAHKTFFKKKRKKKSNSQILKSKLYDLWCEIIHSEKQCELCGKADGKLDAHHIEGRKGVLLWTILNGILLCFRCHRLGVHSEVSSVQAEYREKIAQKRGQDVLDKLKALRYDTSQPTVSELEGLVRFFEALKAQKINNK